MKLNKIFETSLVLIAMMLTQSCGKDPLLSIVGNVVPVNNPSNNASLPPMSGDNVLLLTVNGANCTPNSYINKPCISVTVCAPDDLSNCQTINDILLDTGSVGLRIFKSALNADLAAALTQITVAGKSLAECVQFGDGSADWGPVKRANVVLGNEPPVLTPIHVWDSTFQTSPASCPDPEPSPAHAGFKGILGVNFFTHDCGAVCAAAINNGMYFGCNGTTCTATTAALTNQVQNPVALLPVDNNGVILKLPNVSDEGADSASGYLVIGIGTRSNNSPAGVTAYHANSSGDFKTVYSGKTYTYSFIDSGSNALYFEAPSASILPDCTEATGFFCPSSTKSFTAIVKDTSGTPQVTVPFHVGNVINLANSGGHVFSNIAGDGSMGGSMVFDWGLPFFFGRNVYVGLEGKSSSLGSGTYWAF